MMIKLRHITKSFNDEVKILDDVSLSFVEGKIYAILGVSGSGKSTLLNILGLLDFDYTGLYTIDGVSVNKNNANQLLNQTISYVYQRPIMFDSLSYVDNINIPHFLNDDKLNEKVINKYLKKFNLKTTSGKRMNKFSGGELQRVSLARGLLSNKKIILLDETTSALDSKNQEIVKQELIASKNRHIIIFVTHDKEFARTMADEIIYIEDGKVKQEENKKEVQQVYLKVTKNKKLSLANALTITKSLILSNKKRIVTFTSLLSGGLSALCIALSLCAGFMSYFEKLIGGEVSKYVYFINYKNEKDITYQDYQYFKEHYDVDHAVVCDTSLLSCVNETGSLFLRVDTEELGETLINYQIDHELKVSYKISSDIYDELKDIKHLHLSYNGLSRTLSFSQDMVVDSNKSLISKKGELIDNINNKALHGKYLYVYSIKKITVPYGSPYEVEHVYKSFYDPLKEVIDLIKKGVVIFCGISLFISLLGVTTISLLDLYDRKQQIGLLKLNGWDIKDIAKVLILEILFKEALIVFITSISSFFGVKSMNKALNGMYEGDFIIVLEGKTLLLILLINTVVMILSSSIPFVKLIRSDTASNLHN